MHVLIIVNDSLSNLMGGVTVQVIETVKAMEHIAPDTYFTIVSSDKEIKYHKNHRIIPNNPLFNDKSSGVNNSPSVVATIMNLFKVSKHPDLIHFFDVYTFTVARTLKHHWNIPILYSLTLSVFAQTHTLKKYIGITENSELTNLEFQALGESDKTHMCSNYMVSFFPPIYNVSVIPNGYSTPTIVGSIPTQIRKILFIGRATLTKGIHNLLKAINQLDHLDFVFSFIISPAGFDENMDKAVRKICTEKENCVFLGSKYDDEKWQEIAKHDAIIMPSIYEPFGLVSLEAQVCQRLLICSRVNGLREIIPENSCITCGDNYEGIVSALMRSYELSAIDIKTYVENGLDNCKKYSWKKTAKQIDGLYDSLINYY